MAKGRHCPEKTLLPPLLPGTEYQVEDKDLQRVANLRPLAAACALHAQAKDLSFTDRRTLCRQFEEQAIRSRDFFEQTGSRAKSLPAAERLSFVRSGGIWIQDVLTWARSCIGSGTLDLDGWDSLGDRLLSLIDEHNVIQEIRAEAARKQTSQIQHEIRRTLAPAKKRAAAPETTTGSGLFSAAQLAEKHGVPQQALRKRLERWRRYHGEGCEELESRRKNQPTFWYRESAVMHVVEDLKTSEARRRARSSRSNRGTK